MELLLTSLHTSKQAIDDLARERGSCNIMLGIYMCRGKRYYGDCQRRERAWDKNMKWRRGINRRKGNGMDGVDLVK